MELARTRYSRVRIDDDSKVISESWSNVNSVDMYKTLKSLGFEKPDKFNIIILPLQKKFFCEDGIGFSILPQGSDSGKKQNSSSRVSEFLLEQSDFLMIEAKDEKKILVLFYMESNQDSKQVFASRLEISVNGSAQVIELFDQRAYFSAVSSLRINVLENSELEFFSSENTNSSLVLSKEFDLKKGSRLNLGRIWLGDSRIFSFEDYFLEEYSSCSVRDVILGRRNKFIEFNSTIEHIGCGSTGYLSARAVMYDSSSVNYVGGARVKGNAVNSDSYVELKAIKMSDKAKVYFVPLMEIDTNLVKAKHSSSISKVSETELFYIMSRGLSEDLAKKLIVDGFVQESVDKMPILGDLDLIPSFLFPYQRVSI